MSNIHTRLAKLEAMRPVDTDRLVLIVPRGEPTDEQQAQADAAHAAGREVFTIEIQPRYAAGRAAS